MKKGFTMVELLAVLTLLGIILAITLPQVTSLLKKNSSSSYEEFKESIFLATEAYVADKKINIAKCTSQNIYIKNIIEAGYLKSSLVNPNSKKKMSEMNLNNARVRTTRSCDGILSYEFYES